jgi:hypothetical protein
LRDFIEFLGLVPMNSSAKISKADKEEALKYNMIN